MKNKFIYIAFIFFISQSICFGQQNVTNNSIDFVIAFGSCNKSDLENKLWDDILVQKPNLWIWGGDNIYADTEDMEKMRADYSKLLADPYYKELTENAKVLGTWDDHDYGVNDGGTEFPKKKESQQLFLDFFNVAKNDIRRSRQGIYHSEVFETDNGVIKIIVLDTRYHRTSLTKDNKTKKRYQPGPEGKGTILGDEQWKWLERELKNTTADFNIVVSSIQLLSDKHGWEGWCNFPHETTRFFILLTDSKAKGVIVLSGDRHISDFSKKELSGMKYPLIDFTSSGLTHAATSNKGEENPYRVGKLVNQVSFGVLKFNFNTKTVLMEMRGDQGKVYQKLKQSY